MRTYLIQKEKAEVEHFSSGKKSWAYKLLFKATYWKDRDPVFLPIVVEWLIDGDDDNIIKRAKKEARKYFLNQEKSVW